MKRTEFLYSLTSPIEGAVMKKYPVGNIMQGWGESPELYSKAFGFKDDFHKYIGGHSGLDISTFHRDDVVATHAGKVVQVRQDRKSVGGLVVYVKSETMQDRGKTVYFVTAYGHLDEITVELGQELQKGHVIGLEGNTGFVISGGTAYWGDAPAGKGTHLHYSIYEYILKDKSWQRRWINALHGSIDPLPWLTGNMTGWMQILEQAKKLLLFWRKKYG